MDSNIKFMFVVMALAVVFVIGLKCGEGHVIRHQRIETTDTGYLVDFDGDYYEYDAD